MKEQTCAITAQTQDQYFTTGNEEAQRPSLDSLFGNPIIEF